MARDRAGLRRPTGARPQLELRRGVGLAVTVGVGEFDVPTAVAVGIDIRHVAGERAVGKPVAVGIGQPVVALPVRVDIDQWSTGVLHSVEPEPPQLPRPIDGRHRPGAGAVVGEELGSGRVVADHVVGHAVTVQVGHRVVEQTVTVEIQPNRVQ